MSCDSWISRWIGGLLPGVSHGQSQDCVCGPSFEQHPPAVVKEHQRAYARYGESAQGNEYQLQFLSIGFVPQVLFEVEAIHILVDESERVCLTRVDPHELYYIHTSVVKEGTGANFVVESLWGVSSVPLGVGCEYNVPRRPEQHRMTRSNDMTSG